MGNVQTVCGVVRAVSGWQRIYVHIGKNLRVMREAKKVSLRELARRIEKTPGAVSKIETGETDKPEFDTIALAAKALDITLDELQRGELSDVPVTPRMLGHYARARFRAWRREGVRITDIAKRCGLDAAQVKRIWNGGPVGDVNAALVARALDMRDEAELSQVAREWWRTTGRDLVAVTRSDEDPVDARSHANADSREYLVSDDDVLGAIEMNPNRETESEEFWFKAFLAAHKERVDAEIADAQVQEATQRQRKKSSAEREAATNAAAEKLSRARSKEADEAPASSHRKPRKTAS